MDPVAHSEEHVGVNWFVIYEIGHCMNVNRNNNIPQVGTKGMQHVA
jgi:hypothetical protein